MTNLIIAQAVKEDLPAIINIQRKAFGEVAKTFHLKSMPQIEQTLESIMDEFNHCTFLKASTADTIIGSVRAYKRDNTCYIHRLIVLPEYQNQGIGKVLMAEIEKRFKNSVQRYELFTGSRDPRNLYLYDKLGYKTFKTEKHNHGYKPQMSIGKSFCSKIWGLIPSALRDCSANRFRCASPGIRRSSLSESEFHNDEISFVYMEKSI